MTSVPAMSYPGSEAYFHEAHLKQRVLERRRGSRCDGTRPPTQVLHTVSAHYSILSKLLCHFSI